MKKKCGKNAICLLYYKFTNPFLTILQLGRPGNSRVARLWICEFVNIKQMAFLQILVSQQLLLLFSKHLDTMSNVMDCVSGQTDLWEIVICIIFLGSFSLF